MAGSQDVVDDPRNAKVLVWINGRLVSREQATISVFEGGYIAARRRLGGVAPAPRPIAVPGRPSGPAVPWCHRDRPGYRQNPSGNRGRLVGDLQRQQDDRWSSHAPDGHPRGETDPQPGPEADDRQRHDRDHRRIQGPSTGARHHRAQPVDLHDPLHAP